MASMIRGEMSETVLVACRECRRAFPAGLQVDRCTLEALVVDERYRCPHCGAESRYVKADHYFELRLDPEGLIDGI
jgi:DNA-directed RNA polymerase subunit RPC12/RpoP